MKTRKFRLTSAVAVTLCALSINTSMADRGYGESSEAYSGDRDDADDNRSYQPNSGYPTSTPSYPIGTGYAINPRPYSANGGYPVTQSAYPSVPGYAVPNPNMQYLAPAAPPPPIQEIIIAPPGPGYTWIAGYWHWQNGWVWVPGQWIVPPRPGLRWIGPQWVPHGDGDDDRFRMEHGGWR
jgi:hypothetical protein